MSMQFVNIAIVLVAMYVALALACSWIVAQIAALINLRSDTLESGITALVSGDVGVIGALCEHPLITSGAIGSGRFPSYVDKRNFSLT